MHDKRRYIEPFQVVAKVCFRETHNMHENREIGSIAKFEWTEVESGKDSKGRNF